MSLPPFRLNSDPAIEVANISESLLVRINRMNLFAHRPQYRERWNLGPDKDLGPNWHADRVRHIHRGLGGIAQPVIASIADNADDLKPAVASGGHQSKRRLALQFGYTDFAPDGVAVRKILASQGLIDDRELGAVHRLAFIPDSALQQRNSKHREIRRTDEVDPRFLLFCRRLAGNLETLLPSIVWGRGIGRKPRGNNFRHRTNLLQELIEVASPGLPCRVSVVMHRDADRHNVVRIIAKVHKHHAHEALHRNARPGQQ